jgi:hypothetical protein
MTGFMNKKLFKQLVNWPKCYVSGTSLSHLLNGSVDSRHGIIKRAIQEGVLIPLRRDLFLIDQPRQEPVNLFEIAPIIYGPSYISFESALSAHGWIPEAVRTTTCATVKKRNEFDTPVGVFLYSHIPVEAFSIGVEQQYQNQATIFIASPMKAIADMIYARKKSWATMEDLCEDLRIEPESIKESDKKMLGELADEYPSSRVRKALKKLYKELILL